MLVPSNNDLFRGKMIEKPPVAMLIYDAKDEPLYTCPHCKQVTDGDACDVLGAEDGCCFCPNCSGEFEM